MFAKPPPYREQPRSRWRGFLENVQSLQCKATILVVAVTMTVTFAASGFLLRSSVTILRAQHEDRLTQLAAMLARSVADPLSRGDAAAVQSMVRGAVNGGPLAYAMITDPSGADVTTSWARTASGLEHFVLPPSERPPVTGTPAFHQTTSAIPAFLDIVYPISLRSREEGTSSGERHARLLGYVRAGLMARGWYETLTSRIDLLIGIGIIASVVAIPLGFLLIRRIVAPMAHLEGVMQRFSQGDLKARASACGRDEIGRLALAFNRMADQHENTHARIVRLNTDLEGRVAQRTRQLRELAAREPLTGLFNRRHFSEMLERCFAEAMRYGHDLACIMIDLDNFKGLNDTCGHHAGDELLILMAGTISTELRTSDVPARYGGDEFIILLPQTGEERALVLGERIRESFTTEVAGRFPQFAVGLSAGIASLRAVHARNAEALIRAADRSLYAAKNAGRNCIVSASELQNSEPIESR